jgi:hypothetical protein
MGRATCGLAGKAVGYCIEIGTPYFNHKLKQQALTIRAKLY